MNNTLAIAQREITDRRFVFIAATAFLVLALLVPFMPGVRPGERTAALVVGSLGLAMNFTLGLAAILGSSIVGRELSDGRLSFYFSKPVKATSIWWGKVLAAFALIVLCFTIIAVPALVAGSTTAVRRWFNGSQDQFGAVSWVLSFAFALFLLAHVIGTYVRSRSAWFAFDFVAAVVCGAAIWMIGQSLGLGYAVGLRWTLAKILGVLIAIAILAAGAWQIAKGRTDRKRSHMELSRFMWSAIGCIMLLLIGYVMWVVSVPLSRLVNLEFSQANSGPWSVITGAGKNRGDYHATFFYNLADGHSIRVPAVPPWLVRFSADGKTAAWIMRDGLYVLHFDAPKPQPVLTRITGDRIVSLSDDGSRAVVISGQVFTTYDLGREASLGSTRGFPVVRPAARFEVEDRGSGSVLHAAGKEIVLPEPRGRWLFTTQTSNGIVVVGLRQHLVTVDINRGVVLRQDDRMICFAGAAGPDVLCRSGAGLIIWNPATGQKRPVS